jgi:hypothetical protein
VDIATNETTPIFFHQIITVSYRIRRGSAANSDDFGRLLLHL